MTAEEVLAAAVQRGIELLLEGEQLLFRSPPGALSPALRASLAEHKAAIISLLRESDSCAILPLSHGQRALWFLWHLEQDTAAYNLMHALRIRGSLDHARLQAAFQTLADKHSTLRTTFATFDGAPAQRLHARRPVSMEQLDMHGWSDDDLLARLDADARIPIDLDRGPIFRIRLYRRAAEECILLLTIHHIVIDYWSLDLLTAELAKLYGGGNAAILPGQSYVDFVRWQRDLLSSPRSDQLWDYWKDALAVPPPALDLPTDRSRGNVRISRGAELRFPIGPDLGASLRGLAAECATTPFTAFLAAWMVLLARCSGQIDLLVGTPVSGRTAPELERIVGYLINTVVLRGNLSGDPCFRDFLMQLRSTVRGALDHQDYPLPLLVERLHPRRDSSRSPFYDAMFVWDRVAPPGALLGWEIFCSGQRAGAVDILLTIYEGRGSLEGVLQYSTALFNASTIERMAERYTMLLAGIVANPEERISQLELLSGEERDRVLVSFNATAEDYPRDRTVLEWIEERARVRPEEIAVVDGRGSISRGELERRAEQLAATLRGKGAGRGSPVGLCIERAIETVLGLLAVWKAGAAYVPLDPGYPGERLAFMLADSGARVLLTQSHLAGRFAAEEERGLKVVAIDQPWVGMQKGDPATPEDVAYVIYTSGSTGEPKGVEIGHRALQNLIWWFGRRSGLKETDGFLSVTSLSFDIAALELLLPLVTGARLVTAQREETLDGELLAARIRDSGATVMQATPVTWRLLLESGWKGGPGMSMWCGGEALSRELAERLLATGGTLWNLYGPTETTIWSALQGVERGSGPVAIGRPVGNTQIYILDQGLQAQPVGVPGEIYIGGEGVAMGYHGRRELTAERFLPNPFAGTGERLYRTGDRGRWREDGSLEYLGREDRQVKLHGFRMELEEIEGALRQHPSIAEAVVEVREEGARQRLVAYLVAQGAAPTAGEVRGFLGSRLPPSMVPSVYVVLDAMPLTPNRKIDRKALPPPGSFRPEKQPFVPPRTPLEQRLVGIFAAVLGVEQVGTEDGFFDLGGASIESIDIVARARQADIPLSVEMLFQHQTVAELASAVESELAAYEQPSS
jgi:amino acid adenylation domain-containing protein